MARTLRNATRVRRSKDGRRFVYCFYKGCGDRRKYSDGPYVARRTQRVYLDGDEKKPYVRFCSMTCAAYAGAFNIQTGDNKGWTLKPT